MDPSRADPANLLRDILLHTAVNAYLAALDNANTAAQMPVKLGAYT